MSKLLKTWSKVLSYLSYLDFSCFWRVATSGSDFIRDCQKRATVSNRDSFFYSGLILVGVRRCSNSNMDADDPDATESSSDDEVHASSESGSEDQGGAGGAAGDERAEGDGEVAAQEEVEPEEEVIRVATQDTVGHEDCKNIREMALAGWFQHHPADAASAFGKYARRLAPNHRLRVHQGDACARLL